MSIFIDRPPPDLEQYEGQDLVNDSYYADPNDDLTLNAQPIEVYQHYARLERAREAADTRPVPDSPWGVTWKKLRGKRSEIVWANEVVQAYQEEKAARKRGRGARVGAVLRKRRSEGEEDKKNPTADVGVYPVTTNGEDDEKPPLDDTPVLTAAEQTTAYRLLRVASWQVVFFLITTDVLGWYTAPMAFAQLGYAPGVMIYTSFYILAFCSGQILWRMYLNLDSERYPVRCYADLGERTYGRWVKHAFNVLQSIQLLFNVAMMLIMDGQALAQIIDFKFCYMALTALFTVVCMFPAQVRTLRGLSSFTNLNLIVNIIVMVLTLIGTGMYDPVPAQSGHEDLSEPIIRSAWVPGYTKGWYQQIVGVQLAVFAYGGAMMFTEFMAEMRKPRDFWKAALAAQGLCWAFYMLFGLIIYSMQGQYTAILPTVNIASTLFQGLTNILGLICICIIAVLYANIGCKVFYRNVVRGYFKAPSLTDAKSRLWWSGTVCTYFALAWVIGSAIPNITDLNTVVGAACIMQFTFTFPPLLLLGHWVQADALAGEPTWVPGMEPGSTRADSWRDASRWKRGFRPWWGAKVYLLLHVMAALCLAALGIYSGVISAEESFASGFTTSFSCRAPGQPL